MRPRAAAFLLALGSITLVIAACQAAPGSPSAAEPAPSASSGLVVDVPFTYRMPDGWQKMSPAALRSQLDAALSNGTASGDIRDAWTWGRDEVDRGHVKAVIVGPSSVRPFTASVIMLVVDPPKSLEAGAADVLAAMPSQFPRLSLQPVDLPIGDAIGATATFAPVGGSPSREVLLFTLLPDGRLLWLDAAAPAGDTGFETLVNGVQQSLVAAP